MPVKKKVSQEELAKKIEDHLFGMYSDLFTRREVLIERSRVFGRIVNTRSHKTGKWLSEVITDSEERADLVGRVIDRIEAKICTSRDTGF